MAFSLDSKVKDILKNPAAAAVLDKFCEGASKNPQMKLVGGLTLRKLASFPQSAYLQPHLEELEKELGEPGPERIWYVGDAFENGFTLDEVHALTHIDPWFLAQIQEIQLDLLQEMSKKR